MELKTYSITIRPESAFGTPLKGDTIFGQFCWQLVEDRELANEDISSLLGAYHESPFAVFSSAWPVISQNHKLRFALPRPNLPPPLMGDPPGVSSCAERLKKRKELKAKRWFLVEEDLKAKLSWNYIVDDSKLLKLLMQSHLDSNLFTQYFHQEPKIVMFSEQQHNTINRLSGTTGTGMFAPYSFNNLWYMPGTELVIFVAINEEQISIEQVKTGLKRIGTFGFGRDASTGLGRFSIGGIREIKWPQPQNRQSVFTLGPCVPEKNLYEEIMFQPFIRFGRHGAQLLHTGRPFKNPIIMADEGAVLVPKADYKLNPPLVGMGVKGLSKALGDTVSQGYSLALPFELG